MAAGADGVVTAWRMAYAALTTLPERRQRVQTRRRRIPPFTIARTRCRFGSNRRGVTLCAWLMFRPTTGPLLQSSQRFAMFPAPDQVETLIITRLWVCRPGCIIPPYSPEIAR